MNRESKNRRQLNESIEKYQIKKLCMPLSTNSRGTRKNNGLSLSETFTNKVEHKVIVNYRVGIMKSVRIWAVVENDICMRNALRKVSLEYRLINQSETRLDFPVAHLESVNTEINKGRQFSGIPSPCMRISHIENG